MINEKTLLEIKNKINKLNKEIEELTKPLDEVNRKEILKNIELTKKKFEKKWVSIIDTDDYLFIEKITEIDEDLITVSGILLTIGQSYNEYDDQIHDVSGYVYEISDFKLIKKEKIISEIEKEKKNRFDYLDKMIKKINSVKE